MTSLALVHFNHKMVDGEVSWNTVGTAERNPNYGDMLVCSALLRQVTRDGVETVRVGFGKEISQPVDSAVLRGSTYLSRKFDYDAAIRTVDSIDAPIAVVGLGAQSPGSELDFLDDIPAARTFISKLVEKSESISVRGEFTGALLERLGAPNVRVTGCPTMFHSLSAPRVTVPAKLRTPEQRLGVSVHSRLGSSIYCRDPQSTRRKHARALAFAMRVSDDVSIFEQGVTLEHTVGNAALPMEERLAAAATIISGFPKGISIDPMDLVTRMVTVRSVEDWLDRASRTDAMIGFRFHGNMAGLTQGIPCYYYTYDSRITEFCDLYKLPHLEVEDKWENPLRAIEEHDWDVANKAIEGCFRELVAFYEENNVTHNLTA